MRIISNYNFGIYNIYKEHDKKIEYKIKYIYPGYYFNILDIKNNLDVYLTYNRMVL